VRRIERVGAKEWGRGSKEIRGKGRERDIPALELQPSSSYLPTVIYLDDQTHDPPLFQF